MTQEISVVVRGLPMVQERHKQWHRNGVTGQVDPSKGAKRDFLMKIQEKAPPIPWDCPIGLTLRLFFPRPRKHYNSKGVLRRDAPDWYSPKKRHDIDNLLKFVMDAISGVFIGDDGLIVDARVLKFYSEQPRTEMLIQVLTEESGESGD